MTRKSLKIGRYTEENVLVFCLVPVIRWLWVIFALVIGIALGNGEFANKVKERITNEKKEI